MRRDIIHPTQIACRMTPHLANNKCHDWRNLQLNIYPAAARVWHYPPTSATTREKYMARQFALHGPRALHASVSIGLQLLPHLVRAASCLDRFSDYKGIGTERWLPEYSSGFQVYSAVAYRFWSTRGNLTRGKNVNCDRDDLFQIEHDPPAHFEPRNRWWLLL